MAPRGSNVNRFWDDRFWDEFNEVLQSKGIAEKQLTSSLSWAHKFSLWLKGVSLKAGLRVVH